MGKVALIGNGHIAKATYIKYFRERNKDYEICAVVNPNVESAKKFIKENSIKKSYKNIDQMLMNEHPDLVIVCSPNRYHYEHVMKCLSKNIHVFCEKPPAMNSKQAKEMYNLAKDNKLFLAYNFPHRYSEETKILRKNIKKLGDVYFIEANAIRKHGIPTWGKFTEKSIQGGGPLIDIGIHILDAALYILNYPKIKSVYANQYTSLSHEKIKAFINNTENNEYTIEDSLFGTIEFENGAILRINTSYLLNVESDEFNIRMVGKQYGANLYPLKIFTNIDMDLIEYEEKNEVTEPLNRFGCLEEFCRKIKKNQFSTQEANEGYMIQYLIESLYLSAETGEKVILKY
ncbi:gfo/Idh/MocA family oxidoreductase [Macrococcoides goetzii]|uniref:Gfo/Idh/MocA family oxidoreductase n=1 Tax=Macrococcoides goetzii TaxID=1891097 RepID=A0A2G5NSG4_9STAP|nr:Gfo/Idh/MocA family oxidoreductase [Macrococcus goetzii]RAI82681.1 gfo/Idh/MocA family oxidoreductase [Macrococcus goetzii]